MSSLHLATPWSSRNCQSLSLPHVRDAYQPIEPGASGLAIHEHATTQPQWRSSPTRRGVAAFGRSLAIMTETLSAERPFTNARERRTSQVRWVYRADLDNRSYELSGMPNINSRCVGSCVSTPNVSLNEQTIVL